MKRNTENNFVTKLLLISEVCGSNPVIDKKIIMNEFTVN